MDEIWVQGGRRLSGSVAAGGSKNATLPVLAATLLAPGIYRFTNVPDLKDISTMLEMLARFGVKSRRTAPHAIEVDTREQENAEAPYALVKTMRASVYVLGPLLARFGRARVSLPGGCAWGPRPVDLHIKGMEALGARVDIDEGYIVASAPKARDSEFGSSLRGTRYTFPISS